MGVRSGASRRQVSPSQWLDLQWCRGERGAWQVASAVCGLRRCAEAGGRLASCAGHWEAACVACDARWALCMGNIARNQESS